jgi:hypothetical protein
MAPAARKVVGSPTHLDEVAVLLALAIARAMGRLRPSTPGESSTGLGPQTERVLAPENGL